MTFDPVTREDLTRLASAPPKTRVSIYLPTQKAGPAVRENPIRLKNLLRDAEEQLVATGMRPTLARDMLEAARAIDEDQEYMEHLSDGLAIFVGDGETHAYRLPISVPELAVVDNRYHLKPLMQLFSEDGAYYLLAISLNEVRFFRGRRHEITEVEISGMPRSMDEALWADDPEKQLQFRTSESGITGRGPVMYHGTGDYSADRQKGDILRYFRKVDRPLTDAIGAQRLPLVLAAVDYLHPIYREANTYENLLEEGLTGSPDERRPEDLARDAWESVVGPYYEELRRQDSERFGNLTGTGKAISDVEEVARAAAAGRVDTLWVTVGQHVWGDVTDDGRIVIHEEQEPGDEDLTDYAAAQTVLNGGRVYALDPGATPGDTGLAAILRY